MWYDWSLVLIKIAFVWLLFEMICLLHKQNKIMNSFISHAYILIKCYRTQENNNADIALFASL